MESSKNGLDIWPSNQNSVEPHQQDHALRSFAQKTNGSTLILHDSEIVNPVNLASRGVKSIIRRSPKAKITCTNAEIVGSYGFEEQDVRTILYFEDIGLLTQRWCQQKGMPYPRKAFFDMLTTDHMRVFGSIFENAWLLKTQTFVAGLYKVCAQTARAIANPLFTVSLDTDFLPYADAAIEVTRVREYMHPEQALGQLARPGHPDFLEQIKALVALLPRDSHLQIQTDGCWSGNEILEMHDALMAHDVRIGSVVAGIITNRAVEELSACDIPLAAFMRTSPAGWICQRDLIPGIKRSGKNVALRVGNPGFNQGYDPDNPRRVRSRIAYHSDLGAPYLFPFDDSWFLEYISVAQQHELAWESLRITKRLFEKLEILWGRPVYVSDLPRTPRFVQPVHQRITDELPYTDYGGLRRRRVADVDRRYIDELCRISRLDLKSYL